MARPKAAQTTEGIGGSLCPRRVPGVKAATPTLPVVVMSGALALAIDSPSPAISDPALLFVEIVAPMPVTTIWELDSFLAGELLVVGHSGTGDVESVSLETVKWDDVRDGDRTALVECDVEKLGDEAYGRFRNGDTPTEVLEGVFEAVRETIEGVEAMRGDGGVILVDGGFAKKGEANMVVGDEEGRIAEVVEGEGAEEEQEVITVLFGL